MEMLLEILAANIYHESIVTKYKQ